MSLDVALSRLFKLFPEGRFPGSGTNGTKSMHISNSPNTSLKAEAASHGCVFIQPVFLECVPLLNLVSMCLIDG